MASLRSPRWRWATTALGAAAVAFLVIGNYRLVDRSQPTGAGAPLLTQKLAAVPLPRNSVVLTMYWRGSRLRYLMYVEARRPDVCVLFLESKQVKPMTEYFVRVGAPTFLMLNLPREERQELRARTPDQFGEVGLLWVNPPAGY